MEITCPNCGRTHKVDTTYYHGVYLNGMPKIRMDAFMAMTVICPCGLLVAAKEFCGVNTKECLSTEAYQTALNATYDSEAEKKLALFDALYHFPQMEMYYTQYYDELGDTNRRNLHLERAVQRILNSTDEQDYLINGDEMYGMKHTYALVLTPERRLIDLYRCLGRFDEAQKQIKKLRKDSDTEEYQAYLKLEASLVKAKNSTIL